jgi:hypothetical protein
MFEPLVIDKLPDTFQECFDLLLLKAKKTVVEEDSGITQQGLSYQNPFTGTVFIIKLFWSSNSYSFYEVHEVCKEYSSGLIYRSDYPKAVLGPNAYKEWMRLCVTP